MPTARRRSIDTVCAILSTTKAIGGNACLIFPFADPTSVGDYLDFETAIYQSLVWRTAYPGSMATDENLRLEHQLCVALYNATRAITGCYRPLLDALGLTYSQFTVMLVLWEHDTTTMRDLGVALHLDSGTLSPVLKRLERAGLVKRERVADDERVLRVTITAAGRRLRQRASAAQRTVEQTTGLGAESLAALRDQLNALAARGWAVAVAG